MRRHPLGGLVWAAALMVLAAGSVSPCRGQDTSGVESHPWIGNGAPSFELASVVGDTLSLQELAGKYVVLHFGASW